MAPPVSLVADLGAYLLVTWADGRVEVEGVGLTADTADLLAPLVATAIEHLRAQADKGAAA